MLAQARRLCLEAGGVIARGEPLDAAGRLGGMVHGACPQAALEKRLPARTHGLHRASPIRVSFRLVIAHDDRASAAVGSRKADERSANIDHQQGLRVLVEARPFQVQKTEPHVWTDMECSAFTLRVSPSGEWKLMPVEVRMN